MCPLSGCVQVRVCMHVSEFVLLVAVWYVLFVVASVVRLHARRFVARVCVRVRVCGCVCARVVGVRCVWLVVGVGVGVEVLLAVLSLLVVVRLDG